MYNLFVSFFPEPEGTTPGGKFIRLVIIVPYFAKAQMLLFLNSAKYNRPYQALENEQ